MTIKKYLEEAWHLEEELNDMNICLNRFEFVYDRVTSVFSAMPHDPNRSRKREEALTDAIDLKKTMEEHICKLMKNKAEIMGLLKKIPDSKIRCIYIMRYMDHCSWEEIGRKMNYSPRHVQRLHDDAMPAVEDLYTKQE